MSLDIKNIFNDALYWATSPQSKDKGYHISRVHDSVLRKLIHYCKNKERVFFTNDVIAKHTYLGEEQVKKSIPLLEKKGFIKCLHLSTRDENNNIIKRRGISINWPTFEKIMDELPTKHAKLDDESDDVIKVDMPIQKPSENVIESEINDSLDYDLCGIVDVEENQMTKKIDSGQASTMYKYDDQVSLYELFKNFGVDIDLSVEFLTQFRNHFEGEENVRFGDILKYVQSIVKEQKYKDYKGVRIDNNIAEKFNKLILR